jgi:hypothetical protein
MSDDDIERDLQRLPLVAEAVFMTSIRCPKCFLRFEIEGNADRLNMACPSCNTSLTVRLR